MRRPLVFQDRSATTLYTIHRSLRNAHSPMVYVLLKISLSRSQFVLELSQYVIAAQKNPYSDAKLRKILIGCSINGKFFTKKNKKSPNRFGLRDFWAALGAISQIRTDKRLLRKLCSVLCLGDLSLDDFYEVEVHVAGLQGQLHL